MSIFLPVAGISLSLLYVLGIGASVGVLSGLVGVGGGFLIAPALMMIGVPPTVAAASGSCQMVATSSSGAAAHFRLGNVDMKMGALLLTGGWLGAAVGVRVIKVLRSSGQADLLITLTYVVVLGALGAYMLVQSLRAMRRGPLVRSSAKPRGRGGMMLSRLPWQMEFRRSAVRHSILFPPLLAFLVGVLASIMGVGGGFIMLPMMVYLLGMPAHVAVGTDLFQIFFLCIGVTYMQAATNQTVDLILALAMAAGSAVGAQVGARLSRLLRGEQLMIVLASLFVGVTIKMVFGLVLTPSNLLHPAEVISPPAISRPVSTLLFAQSTFAVEPSNVKITPSTVELGTFYGGAKIAVTGTVGTGSNVIVVVRGSSGAEVFNKIGRVGPIWVNTGKVTVSAAPTLLLIFTSAPVSASLNPAAIDQYDLDPASLKRHMQIETKAKDRERISTDFLAFKAHQGTYRTVSGSVHLGAPDQGAVLYSLDFDMPRTAAPGTYRVSVIECRNGVVANKWDRELAVVEVGFPALVSELARQHAPVYGIVAVIIAMIAGFGIDFLASRIFKRKVAAH